MARLRSSQVHSRCSRALLGLGWLLAVALACTFCGDGNAQSTSADEYEIRAAMLLNLTRFIVWPPSKLDGPHPQFVICILGRDPIQIDHLNSTDMVSGCDILYIGNGEHKSLKRSLPELAKNNVLTISQKSNADEPDQVIGLPSVEEHVRIDVNLGAAKRAGLTISSKLLRLATVTP
jgi:hypothetical protein